MVFSRDDFPFFVHNPSLVYLDSAASTQKPQAVINAVSHYLAHDYSNIHRGDYDAAFRSEQLYQHTKKLCAQWLGKHERDIVFGPSGTTLAQWIIDALVAMPGIRRVCVGIWDHHATIVPLYLAQQHYHFVLDYCPLDEWGDPDYDRLVRNPCDLFVCSHASNVTGMVVDTYRLRQSLDQKTLLVLDMSQTFAHRDCADASYDACFATSHKAYALTWCWIGRLDPSLRDRCIPRHGGGGIVEDVRTDGFVRKSWTAWREPGTPNLESIVSLGASLEYCLAWWWIAAMREYEHSLDTVMMTMQQQFVDKRWPMIHALPSGTNHCPVYSFSCAWLTQKTGLGLRAVTQRLWDAGVCVRGWGHCAYPLMHFLWLPEGTVRVSCGIYTTPDDIQCFWERMDAFCTCYCL